jgi:KUP system potassium uptake protein
LSQTLFATALTMADGILTPAVSVTSSVGGLAVVAPVVSSNVKPISIGFLLVLFAGQRFGTAKLSFLFAPRECGFGFQVSRLATAYLAGRRAQ